MKRTGRCFMLLLLIFILAGCKERQPELSGYRVYCVNTEGTRLESENYTPKESGEALIQELIGRLAQAPVRPGHRKAVPDGIGITSAVRTETNLKVDFNGTYNEMDHITEVFCRAAVVKTLVQAPEVETVEFTVNGRELADSQGNPVGVMDDDSFIDTKEEGINSYQYASLTLYYASDDGKKIIKELRSVHYSSNTLVERLVLDELFKEPENEKLQAVIPQGGKVLDVTVDGKNCTVNLDEVFGRRSATSVSPEASLHALVNTICDNCNVEEVRIVINDDSSAKYLGTLDISKPFHRDGTLIDPPEQPKAGHDKAPGVGVDPALQE